MKFIGKEQDYLFPESKVNDITLECTKGDVHLAKSFVDANREWKVIGDGYELEEGYISVSHAYKPKPNKISLLYYHMKQKTQPKGVVFTFHGYTSSQRIDCSMIANVLGPRGYEVVGFEQESHGRNVYEKNERCMIHDYRCLIFNSWEFIKKFLRRQRKRIPEETPIFLWGSSMGAATILSMLLEDEYMTEIPISGAVALCPAIEVIDDPGFVRYSCLLLLSYFLPDYTIGEWRKCAPCDHYVDNAKWFQEHAESYDGPMKVATGRELLRLGRNLAANSSRILTPFMLMHGTEDNIIKFSSSERLFEQETVHVKDKLFVRCKDMMHALISDYCAIRVCRMAYHWINIRCERKLEEIHKEKSSRSKIRLRCEGDPSIIKEDGEECEGEEDN